MSKYAEDRERPTHLKECRRCGKGGLLWTDYEGKWRLVDTHGLVHVCDPDRRKKFEGNDFGNVP